MVDINSTLSQIPMLESASAGIQSFVNILQIVIGGLFGLYILILIVKIVYYVKFIKFFKNIRNDISLLSDKINSMDKKLSSLVKKKK